MSVRSLIVGLRWDKNLRCDMGHGGEEHEDQR